MASNVTFQSAQLATPPKATVIATDQIDGAEFQKVRLDIGTTAASAVTAANPLPVTGAVTATTGGLTDTELRASAVAVSGPLTDAELRATAIAVSDNSSTLSVDDGSGSLTVDGTVAATQSGVWAAKFVDENGTAYGVKHVSNKPRVSAMPYLYDIAEGNVSGHTAWEKIGYTALSGTTTKDVWSYTDNTINLPTGATAMEVYTASAQDAGTSLHSGTTTTGGSATTLEKTGENFKTTTAVGDLLIIDAAGTTPEYGFITEVTSDTVLTFSGGLSGGGSGAARATYNVIDVSATSGAHAVIIKYLTTAYAEKSEIVICGGNGVGVDLVNTDVFRINSCRVISAGSGGAAAAAIQVWDADGTTPVYTYITLGYTRARNSLYTVPTGKTLYITQLSGGYATTANQVQSARIILRATQNDGFKTNLFQALAELILTNATSTVEFTMPVKIASGVTMKFTAVPTANGAAVTVARGWLE